MAIYVLYEEERRENLDEGVAQMEGGGGREGGP